jgi:hypothetical protein
MAKTTRMTIRLSEDERRQIHDVVRRLGFEGPSALVQCAIHNELSGRGAASTESEEQVAARDNEIGMRSSRPATIMAFRSATSYSFGRRNAVSPERQCCQATARHQKNPRRRNSESFARLRGFCSRSHAQWSFLHPHNRLPRHFRYALAPYHAV